MSFYAGAGLARLGPAGVNALTLWVSGCLCPPLGAGSSSSLTPEVGWERGLCGVGEVSEEGGHLPICKEGDRSPALSDTLWNENPCSLPLGS